MYRFHVTLTDADYLDYNIFWTTRSPYGKKQMLSLRLLIAVLFLAISLVSLMMGDFTREALLGCIPYLIALVLTEAFFGPFFVFLLKRQIGSLKKRGKMGYSPEAEMEFSEESFSETTPENRTEQRYTAIERISVIGDAVTYIHVNNVMSYIVPRTSFASPEDYRAFLAFLEAKCPTVDRY